MTIAKVAVNFYLAFPQGLLPREVEEELTMRLAAAFKDVHQVVEFDITGVHTKVDPFDKAEVEKRQDWLDRPSTRGLLST